MISRVEIISVKDDFLKSQKIIFCTPPPLFFLDDFRTANVFTKWKCWNAVDLPILACLAPRTSLDKIVVLLHVFPKMSLLDSCKSWVWI